MMLAIAQALHEHHMLLAVVNLLLAYLLKRTDT